ncbi:MAG: zf-TFIIB domain-containing protein [Thermoplasmatota archaeon]
MKVNKKEMRQRIKCPRCELYMKREEIEIPGPNIVIDFCPKCGSYWFDKGELNRYIRDRKPDRMLRRVKGMEEWGKPECPRCGGKISLKFINDLEVDHCDSCGGIWLDHGELKAIQAQDVKVETRLGSILGKLRNR